MKTAQCMLPNTAALVPQTSAPFQPALAVM